MQRCSDIVSAGNWLVCGVELIENMRLVTFSVEIVEFELAAKASSHSVGVLTTRKNSHYFVADSY